MQIKDPLSNAWPNPYKSMSDFCAKNQIPIPKTISEWRLVEYELGEINGLPKSRGRIVCTDGIMCFIQVAPDVLYHGHYTAWVPDMEMIEESEVFPQSKTILPRIANLFQGF